MTPYLHGKILALGILEGRRKWHTIFKMLKKKKNANPRILYPVKVSLGNEGEIKTSQIKENSRKSVATRLFLKE